MKLALECPTYLLRDIQPLADFDWILTHLVLQDEEYAKFYAVSKNYKVLDNSVNELMQPCSLKDMQEAEKIVKPDLIVPPDFLGDRAKTLDSLKKAYSIWDFDRILPCIQCSSLGGVAGFVERVWEMVQEMGFKRVAVPYDTTCSRLNSREVMAKARTQVVTKLIDMEIRHIHLLGMTTVEELEGYKDTPEIKSIDTGVPIVYGMSCMHLDEPWDFKKDRPTMSQMLGVQTFMTSESRYNPGPSDRLSAIFWNIAYLRKVINGR